MLALGDDKFLYHLDFGPLEKKSKIVPGTALSLISIEKELDQYFKGSLTEFKTPLCYFGTPFQRLAWEELQKIPFGQTRSYGEIARTLGKPTAFRAVARANSQNRLAVVIPCHRVINTNGQIAGYAGGVERKKWLLDHEGKCR